MGNGGQQTIHYMTKVKFLFSFDDTPLTVRALVHALIVWWHNAIGENIQNAFLGNPPAPLSNYVSFPEEPDGYFLKGIKTGAWTAELADLYVNSIREGQRDIGGFDLGLKRIMFGVGGSHIFCFDNGFQAKLQGIHDHPDNSLHKVGRFSRPSVLHD